MCDNINITEQSNVLRRPHLPHLIALLTRREHVRPYRVSAVLTLQTRFPLDPSLPGLIQKFRTFYPVRIPPGIGLAAGKRSYRVRTCLNVLNSSNSSSR